MHIANVLYFCQITEHESISISMFRLTVITIFFRLPFKKYLKTDSFDWGFWKSLFVIGGGDIQPDASHIEIVSALQMSESMPKLGMELPILVT